MEKALRIEAFRNIGFKNNVLKFLVNNCCGKKNYNLWQIVSIDLLQRYFRIQI